MLRYPPSPSSDGRGDVIGVARQAIAQHLGIDLRAPRLGVLVFLQHHHARALAHHEPVAVGVIGAAGLGRIIRALGRQRLAGVEPGDPDLARSGFPPRPPPSRRHRPTGSAAPHRRWHARPVEQAVTTAWFGPLKPKRIDTCPEIRLISAPGMKKGDTRFGPFSLISTAVSAIEVSPPIPDPIITPGAQRVLLGLRHPARHPRTACTAAAIP